MASAAKVVIGCKLPNGFTLVLQSSAKGELNEELGRVTLGGPQSSRIKGATFGTTEVDSEFWETWKKLHHKSKILRNHSIFEARSNQEAEAKAKDLSKEKTGLEALSPEAHGVVTVAKDE